MEMGTLIFDIDGTICSQVGTNYELAEPYYDIIKKINKKYDEGYQIILFTARGSETKIDHSLLTINQLKKWGVKYHTLKFEKPAGDLYIDDKGINIYNWDINIENKKIIEKPWGREYLLDLTDKYAFKRLEINKDKNISKQYHVLKEETWHIIEGYGQAIINGKYYDVKPGMTFSIPRKMIHQIKALSNKLVLIEASTIELNDVIRLGEDFQCI